MEILINLIFLCAGFFIITKSQDRYSSYFNHFNIFGIIWPFIIVGTQLFYYDKIKIEVVVLYYFCWLFYLGGSLILKHRTYGLPVYTQGVFRRMQILVFFLFALCIISNLELIQLIIETQNVLAWAALRKEKAFEDLESNIFYTLFQRAYLIYIPLGILLYKNKKISKLILVALIVSGLFYSLLRFTRAPILNYFIVLLIAYVYIYRKKIPIFAIVISVAFIFIIFGASMSILTEGISKYNVYDDIKLYLFGGQVVYQDFLEGKYIDNVRYDINLFSIDFLNYILERIGVIDSYPSYVREFTNRSMLITNTYTYLDAFTYDFGIAGAIIGSFLLGLFSDYVYHLYAKRNNVFVLIFYGNICYYSCFVFANNEFIRFSALLTVVTLLLYNFLVIRNVKYVR